MTSIDPWPFDWRVNRGSVKHWLTPADLLRPVNRNTACEDKLDELQDSRGHRTQKRPGVGASSYYQTIPTDLANWLVWLAPPKIVCVTCVTWQTDLHTWLVLFTDTRLNTPPCLILFYGTHPHCTPFCNPGLYMRSTLPCLLVLITVLCNLGIFCAESDNWRKWR